MIVMHFIFNSSDRSVLSEFKACAQRTSLRGIPTFTEAFVLRHLLQSLVFQVGLTLSGTVKNTAKASSINVGKAEGKAGRAKGEIMCIDLHHGWAWQ